MTAVRRFLVCLLAAIALPACGHHSAACQAAAGEPIDPLSSQHLLPGVPAPHYLTDPPTSGAHRPGPLPPDILTTPLDRPAQVAALEGGQVLLQYRDLTAKDRRALESIARNYEHVTVLPNHELPTKVVATAWLFMQRCDGVNSRALQDFVVLHGAKHKAD